MCWKWEEKIKCSVVIESGNSLQVLSSFQVFIDYKTYKRIKLIILNKIFPPLTTPSHPSLESEENNFGLAFAWQFSLPHFFPIFFCAEIRKSSMKENNTKISKSH